MTAQRMVILKMVIKTMFIRLHALRCCWVGEDRDMVRIGVERSLIA